MEIAPNITPRQAAIRFGIAAICLTIGVFAGRATVEQVPPPETEVIPPFSTKTMGDQLRVSWCVQNKAFSDYSRSDDHSVRRDVYTQRVQATPLSDRGLVCSIRGTVTETYYPAGRVTRTEFNKVLIVALNGDAEFVTEEFALALSQSPAIKAMASNLGNDGTITPKVRASF